MYANCDLKIPNMAAVFHMMVLTMIVVVYGEDSGLPIDYEIQEDLPVGTFIGNVVYDAGLNKKYSENVLRSMRFVYLIQGIHKELILLEENTGNLATATNLDRDEFCENMVDCVVRLDIAVRPTQYFEIIKVVIRIVDHNDHAPQFPQTHVSYSLSESTGPGVLFPVLPATDPDSPANSVKGYEMLSGGKKFQLQVKPQPDGTFDLHLVLKEMLDREEQETYRLKAVAFDGGVPSRSGSVIFTITVLDTNDNSPHFDRPVYEVEVLENFEIKDAIIQVSASDPDKGDNGKVLYSFAPKTQKAYGELFDIEQDTGKIYQKVALDYEEQNAYSLTIVAQDQGPDSLPVTCRVQVHVIDQNDNRPVITVNSLDGSGHIKIQEHSEPDMFIAHISVVDKDGGKNGEVECMLDNPQFTLKKMYEAEYKVVTKSDLDRELQGQHELLIKCHDLGSPSHSVDTTLFVTVQDINDNAPSFSKSTYVASIRENSALNEYIAQLWASDKDVGENGKIRYEVDKDAKQYITVHPRTGVVTANTKFDREKFSVKDLIVYAIDDGDPAKTATATIVLNVLDLDDEAPVFSTKHYRFDITENVPVRTEVGQVFAEDRDAPPHNHFSFYMDMDHDNSEMFTLDANTGIIYSKQELDREYMELYELRVLVQSEQAPHMSDTSRVHIHINDQNDNEPLIYYPSQINNTVYLSNKAPINYPVTRIKAYDPDAGDNGRLTYAISAGNEKGEFAIDATTGQIKVNSELRDFEKQVFSLIVDVSDNGRPQFLEKETLYIVVNNTLAVTPAPHTSPYYIPLSEVEIAIIVGSGLGLMLVLMVLIIIVFVMRRRKLRHQRKCMPPQTTTSASSNNVVAGVGGGVITKTAGIGGAAGKRKKDKKANIAMQKNGHLTSGSYSELDDVPMSQQSTLSVDRKPMRTFQGSYEELPQDEDDKDTLPAISPVDEQHHNFSYWVKGDDNYYQQQQQHQQHHGHHKPGNKMAAPASSPDPSCRNAKSVRFDDPLRNPTNGQQKRVKVRGEYDPNDPSCYPLTGGGGQHSDDECNRKSIPCYDTQDGILV